MRLPEDLVDTRLAVVGFGQMPVARTVETTMEYFCGRSLRSALDDPGAPA